MTDGYITLDVTAGQALPPNDLMQLLGGSIPIRCVTVNNNSSMTVGLFPGMNSPQGTAPITVGAFQTQTIPIASQKAVAVQYSGVNSVSGFIYIHYMDVTQTANAAPIPTLQTPAAKQLVSTGSDSLAANNTNPVTLIQWQLSTSSNQFINSPTFVNGLYLSHLHLDGVPAGLPGWQLFLNNVTRSLVSQFIWQSSQQAPIDIDLATPAQMYIPHATDQIGDIFRLVWQPLNTGYPAFTLFFSIMSYLT